METPSKIHHHGDGKLHRLGTAKGEQWHLDLIGPVVELRAGSRMQEGAIASFLPKVT